ncbi:MAG: hypothetical protein R3E98_18625 [Gemmatimonadota bacterium]
MFDYLDGLAGQTFPPLLLEVLLKSGRTFYLKNVFYPNRETEMIALRVWDLRAADVQSLPEKLNAVPDRDTWENFREIDANLDQANLWVPLAEIEGFMEWHERYWPQPKNDEKAQIGFFSPLRETD